MSPEERSHYNALNFAESVETASKVGQAGRAVLLFQHALNYEIDAINACLKTEPVDIPRLRLLYTNAARYAQACGRLRKAGHFLARASELIEQKLSVQNKQEGVEAENGAA